MIKTKYKFKPAIFFNFLTPFYDLFGKINLRGKLHKKIFKQIKLEEGWKILDVGCGTATDLIILRSRCPKAKLYGIDADSKMINLALKKIKERRLDFNLKTALAEKLPFKNNFFDAIWCSQTLHHLPTEYKKQALRETYRVLKPNGKYFLTIVSKPKNPILAKIVSIQNLIEHTKDNYEGKIPGLVKEAGFKNVRETEIWLNASFIESNK